MAEWDTAYVNNLPDSAFAAILPGGKKDDSGKTTPRDLRKLPHHDSSGGVDKPHLRNALARLPNTDLPGDLKSKAESHLEAHAKAEGVGQDSMEGQQREDDIAALEAYERGLAEAPVLYKPAGYLKAQEQAEGYTVFVASEESQDRMGDIIEVAGWQTDDFKRNPVFMLNHDYSILPIGTVGALRTEGKQLLAGVKWDTEDELAAFVKGKYQRGIMRAVSVGFRPLEFERQDDGIRFKRQELLELSAVSVPAHPNALAKMMGNRRFSIIKPEIIQVEEAEVVPSLSKLDFAAIRSALQNLKEVAQ